MYSAEEPNSFFGGMAANSWNSEDDYIEDPAYECSWLFKLEAGENNKYFFYFTIIKESIFINGNALIRKKLFMDIEVTFLILRVNFLRLWTLLWSFFLIY